MDDLSNINPSDFGVLSFSHELPSSAEVIRRAKEFKEYKSIKERIAIVFARFYHRISNYFM